MGMSVIVIRGNDNHGSGAYRASRGSRLHRGVDICCEVGDGVRSLCPGVVTKIGYPYSQRVDTVSTNKEKRDKYALKKALRYVQVTDDYGISVRYFYISPSVMLGDEVGPGDVLGISQGLAHIYPGITEHYHFETLMMVRRKKVFLDPEQFIKAYGG